MIESTFKALHTYCRNLFNAILLCALLLGTACSTLLDTKPAEAAQYDTNSYKEVIFNLANGLNSDAANAIAQTGDGFIWIGGYSGLTRYDGSDFYHIPSGSTGIYSVAALFVDSEDRLWVGTNNNGIALKKEGKFEFWNRGLGLASNTVRSITQNQQGTIFVATTKGLSLIENNKATTIEDLRLLNTYISKVTKAHKNKIAGITKQGDIFVFKGNKLESFFPAKVFPLKNTTAIVADSVYPDVYWLANATNIVMKVTIAGDSYKIEDTLLAEGKRSINDLKQLRNGNLLVAADDGLGYFDDKKRFHAFNGMKFNNSLDAIMVDYEDNLWLASSRQGVAKLAYNRFKNLFADAGLAPAVVNAVQIYQGATYVASDSGLFVLKDGKPVPDHPLSVLLKNKRVRHLLVDNKNNLWVSTYTSNGLIKYTQKGTITRFNSANGLVSDRIRVALQDEDGIIYAGTRDGLALIKDDKPFRNFTMGEGLANSQVLCLLEHNGTVYAGTDGGGITVLRDGNIVDTIDEHVGLENGVILRMTMDPNGKTLWIATNTALAYYEDGRAQSVTQFEGSNNFDIIFTEQDNMLITCNRGIYVTNRDLLKQGKYNQILTAREGLNGSLTANSFNYVDNKGNLYLCLQNGLDKLNLRDIFKSDTSMKLSVPSVKLDGVEHFFDAYRTLYIPSTVENVSFRGYIISNKLDDAFLSVQLEGYDKNFHKFSRFKNQDCVYNNLPGGTYTIKIGIVDPQTNVVAKSESYTLVKEHHWTDYARTITGVFCIVGMIFFLFYRNATGKRIKRLDKKQKETEKFLDEIIDAFAKAIDLKDHYTSGHSDRVAEYSKLIALEMGLGEDEAENIYRIGKLHDVGKVIVPYDVLNKPSRLTEDEYAVMKQHTDNGYKILATITSFPRIAIGAKTHHERYDGKGYGHGLMGKDIPLEGRIIAVADTFDAMNSTRIYRPHLSKEVILEELEKAKNTQLDGEIVDVLLRLIREGKLVIEEADTPV